MAFNYDLRAVNNLRQLMKYIGVDEGAYELVSDFSPPVEIPPRDGEGEFVPYQPFYRHYIPKKNRAAGFRVVWEAEPLINNVYKGLSRRLSSFFGLCYPVFPHSSCYGYVQGRNTRQNAAIHAGAKYISKVDIKSFFESIDDVAIANLFERLGVAEPASTGMARFLTISGRLAPGLPTSGVVANAICYEMDENLQRSAQLEGAVYSRYADDLTFSSQGNPIELDNYSDVIRKHGFAINPSKTRSSVRGQCHYVTGLSVSDDVPHAPRAMKRRLRQELHYASKYGLRGHMSRIGMMGPYNRQRHVNHLDGLVKYVCFQEPRLTRGYIELWDTVLRESGYRPSFDPKNQYDNPFYVYVDETEFSLNGKRYLAVGISASQHQDVINNLSKQLISDYIADPWSDGKKKSFRDNGLHFSDATEDLRLKYIEVMQNLPFYGYIAYSALPDGSVYCNVYIDIIRRVVKRRLMAAESKFAVFCFEENSKVPRAELESIVVRAWQNLKTSSNRCPRQVLVKFVGKSSVGVSVPDFMLGVFRKYIQSGPVTSPPKREHILFERLRDKIRLIFDLDAGKEYSRRNPL